MREGLGVQDFCFLAQVDIARINAADRRIKVEVSGTGVIGLPSGPLGIAWMVSVAPLPMVSVPWLMD